MTQEPQRIPTYRKMLGFVPHPNLRGLPQDVGVRSSPQPTRAIQGPPYAGGCEYRLVPTGTDIRVRGQANCPRAGVPASKTKEPPPFRAGRHQRNHLRVGSTKESGPQKSLRIAPIYSLDGVGARELILPTRRRAPHENGRAFQITKSHRRVGRFRPPISPLACTRELPTTRCGLRDSRRYRR